MGACCFTRNNNINDTPSSTHRINTIDVKNLSLKVDKITSPNEILKTGIIDNENYIVNVNKIVNDQEYTENDKTFHTSKIDDGNNDIFKTRSSFNVRNYL